jgi:hypothetical protein
MPATPNLPSQRLLASQAARLARKLNNLYVLGVGAFFLFPFGLGSAADCAIVGPVPAHEVPRYAGIATFAKLPRVDDERIRGNYDVALCGIPFDGGTTYRPGARFGPDAIRRASRLLRPYHQEHKVQLFARSKP